MKKNILILLAIFFFSIFPLISSITDLGTFKVGEMIKLTQVCSDATYINISSINYPNSSTSILNIEMTSSGNGEYYYYYNNASLLGRYDVKGVSDGCEETFATYFTITPNGSELTSGKSILFIVFLFGLGAIFLLCLYGSIKISWKNTRNNDGEVISINDLKYFKLFCIVMTYTILLMFFGLSRSIFANYIFESGLDVFFNWGYWIMLSCMFPIIVCSLLFALIIFLQDKKMLRAIERGVPIK